MRHRIILTLLACLAAVGTATAASTSLFDGKSFAGWDGDTNTIWRITDGCFVGGSMNAKIKQNEFLATTRNYTNFIIKLKFKLLGESKKDFVNSGVQIRASMSGLSALGRLRAQSPTRPRLRKVPQLLGKADHRARPVAPLAPHNSGMLHTV